MPEPAALYAQKDEKICCKIWLFVRILVQKGSAEARFPQRSVKSWRPEHRIPADCWQRVILCHRGPCPDGCLTKC